MTTLQVSRRLFSVHEYHLMARAGILCEDDRVELIDGEIVEMAPIGSRHAARVDWLTRVFTEVGGGCHSSSPESHRFGGTKRAAAQHYPAAPAA